MYFGVWTKDGKQLFKQESIKLPFSKIIRETYFVSFGFNDEGNLIIARPDPTTNLLVLNLKGEVMFAHEHDWTYEYEIQSQGNLMLVKPNKGNTVNLLDHEGTIVCSLMHPNDKVNEINQAYFPKKETILTYSKNNRTIYQWHLPVEFLNHNLTIEQTQLCVKLFESQETKKPITLTDDEKETLLSFEEPVQEWLIRKYNLIR